MLFRIEDENGFDAKLREYNKSGMDNVTMHSSVADKFVADEIRREVNGANDRNLFSCTRSLAVALFKYNDVGDNPLVLAEYLENTLWVETEEDGILTLPYDIRDLEHPIKYFCPNQAVRILNYVVPVDNNNVLNRYLMHYTGTQKKKMAAVLKDWEVVVKHMSDECKITEHIDAVYILYALQMRTRFLNKNSAIYFLEKAYEKIEDSAEQKGFIVLTNYLQQEYNYEKQISRTITIEKINEPRFMLYYDSYTIACDLLRRMETVEDAWAIACDYSTDWLVDAVWDAYGNSRNALFD